MTNEELKKKIVEVVLDSEITGIQIRTITGGYSMANNIADALIAAGIGDVKEAQHRADAAEQVLHDFAKLLGMGDVEKEEELYSDWLNGAKKKLSEKELAKEGQ